MARVVIPGLAHHVTQRGNRQQNVFLTDDHRQVYLKTVRKYCDKYGLQILGYCLMTNHVHLIAVPLREDSLAKGLGRAHNDYARWFNITQGQTGHLWQNRYFSCPLEDRHLWEALRYVELNPVRARLVARPDEWRWSSARAHLGQSDESGLLSMGPWRQCYDERRWREVLALGVGAAELEQRIREATRTGRPFGSEAFLERLEEHTGRRLRPQRRGRKKRLAAAAGNDGSGKLKSVNA